MVVQGDRGGLDSYGKIGTAVVTLFLTATEEQLDRPVFRAGLHLAAVLLPLRTRACFEPLALASACEP